MKNTKQPASSRKPSPTRTNNFTSRRGPVAVEVGSGFIRGNDIELIIGDRAYTAVRVQDCNSQHPPDWRILAADHRGNKVAVGTGWNSRLSLDNRIRLFVSSEAASQTEYTAIPQEKKRASDPEFSIQFGR